MTREQKIEAVKLLAATLPEEQGKKVLEDARTTFIREDVRAEYEQPDVEAILRSTVAILCDEIAHLYALVSQLHNGQIDNKLASEKITEMRALNDKVEAIKKNITQAMN